MTTHWRGLKTGCVFSRAPKTNEDLALQTKLLEGTPTTQKRPKSIGQILLKRMNALYSRGEMCLLSQVAWGADDLSIARYWQASPSSRTLRSCTQR